MTAAGGRNLAKLGSKRIVFDTTLPRYLALIGEAALLTSMFKGRAVIPPAVNYELRKAMPYVPALQALVGEHRLFETASLTDAQQDRAEAVRQLLPPKEPPSPRDNRGEAEAIILAMDGGCPLVIVDGPATKAAGGRGIAYFTAVEVFVYAALMKHCPDAKAWEIYDRLLDSGMGVPAGKWDAANATEAEFAALLAQLRGV